MPQSGPECNVLRQRADFDTLIWQQDGSMVHRAGYGNDKIYLLFAALSKTDFLAEEFGNNRIWSPDFPIEWPFEVLTYL